MEATATGESSPSAPVDDASRSLGGADADEAQGTLLFSSTVTRGQYHQCGTGRRVKLYILEDQAWVDRGTGYCAGVYDEAKDEALLVVRKEELCESLGDVADAVEPTGEGDDPPQKYMLVISPVLASDDILLCSPVVKDDVYQRQQDTLVVWTEPDGSDLALSFQEPEGCNEVWDFLTEVQLHFMLNKDTSYSAEDRRHSMRGPYSDEADEMHAPPFRLPAPMLDNLGTIEQELREACAQSPLRREKVVEWLLNEDYIRKLIPQFHAAEEQELLPHLHQLYDIMKVVLTMNDNVIIEYLLEDDVFFAAIGMLEYNPEFPRLKASYRDYLQHHAHFHQVVEFEDPNVVTKILDTYRLIYLKDVVLARLLDDATLSMISSLVFFYQSDIVNYCVGNKQCLDQIREIVQAVEVPGRKHEAVLFLQQLCSMAKQIQLPGRMSLFRSLVDRDLLQVVEYALVQPEPAIRNAAAEILTATIEYDANSVRAYILAQVAKPTRPLMRLLLDLLLQHGNLGFKGQIAEAIRALLDVSLEGISNSPMAQGSMLKASSDPERFLTWLYKSDIVQLFKPLERLPTFASLDGPLSRFSQEDIALYTHLCELLCYIVSQHSFRSQYYMLTSEIGKHVGALLHAREKPMRLAALRVFRACLGSSNQFMHRHLITIGVLQELLDLLEREAPRDNLVSSACLGFFEQLRKEGIRVLIQHLVEEHSEQMQRLRRIPSLQACFAGLAVEHEERAPTPEPEDDAQDEENYFASEEAQPLVPYGDEDEEASEALDRSVDRVRRRVPDDEDDDDEMLGRLAKRSHTAPKAHGEKKLALRLSSEGRQRAEGRSSP